MSSYAGIPTQVYSLEDFSDFGKVLKVYPLMDVVFVWTAGKLYHFAGVPGCGWSLHETKPFANKKKAQDYANEWIKTI